MRMYQHFPEDRPDWLNEIMRQLQGGGVVVIHRKTRVKSRPQRTVELRTMNDLQEHQSESR